MNIYYNYNSNKHKIHPEFPYCRLSRIRKKNTLYKSIYDYLFDKKQKKINIIEMNTNILNHDLSDT